MPHMNTEKEREVSLNQLAEETGVPARTVRFYIARGLLRGPLQAGRGASYGNEHRKQLAEIKRLQAQGLTLVEIAKSLAHGRSGVSDLTPTAWWNYQIADDVVVLVRADRSPWRMRQIQRAVREMAEQLDLEERGHDADENR